MAGHLCLLCVCAFCALCGWLAGYGRLACACVSCGWQTGGRRERDARFCRRAGVRPGTGSETGGKLGAACVGEVDACSVTKSACGWEGLPQTHSHIFRLLSKGELEYNSNPEYATLQPCRPALLFYKALSPNINEKEEEFLSCTGHGHPHSASYLCRPKRPNRRHTKMRTKNIPAIFFFCFDAPALHTTQRAQHETKR